MKQMIPLTAIAFVMAFTATTQAAIITATYSDSFSNAELNFIETLNLTQFDGSLGTLQSVELTWTFDVDSTAGVENFSANPGFVDLNQDFSLGVDNTTLGSLVNETDGFTNSQGVTGFDGTNDAGGTSGFTASVSPTFSGGDVYTSAPFLAAFTGPGTIDFDVTGIVSITSDFTGSGSGALLNTWNTFSDGELAVTYTYESATQPIPSPAAVWAGLMLAGAAVMRRRNKK